MENTKIFESIGEFSLFLKNATLETEPLIYFGQIQNAHENSIGGCSCNRKNRLAKAIETYKRVIVEATTDNINNLKNVLGVEKIVFKQDGVEFAKF